MIRTTVTAQFPAAGPDHRCLVDRECYCVAARKAAVVRGTGEGSHLKYAIRDAIANIFKSPTLRGKRASALIPVTFTVADAYVIDQTED